MEASSEEKEESETDTETRLIPKRRLVSAVTAAVLYAAVLSVATVTDSSGTAHTLRYLILLSGVYAVLSGVNSLFGYLNARTVHPDTADSAGAFLVTVGLGASYGEVLATEGVSANVYALTFATFAITVGMILVMKVESLPTGKSKQAD